MSSTIDTAVISEIAERIIKAFPDLSLTVVESSWVQKARLTGSFFSVEIYAFESDLVVWHVTDEYDAVVVDSKSFYVDWENADNNRIMDSIKKILDEPLPVDKEL